VTFARSAIFSDDVEIDIFSKDDILFSIPLIPSGSLSLEEVSINTWMTKEEMYVVRQPDVALHVFAVLGMLALDRGMNSLATQLCCRLKPGSATLNTLQDFSKIVPAMFKDRIKLKSYENSPQATEKNCPFIVIVARDSLRYCVIVEEIRNKVVFVRDPLRGAVLKVKRDSFNDRLVSKTGKKIDCIRVAFPVTRNDLRMCLQTHLLKTELKGNVLRYEVFEFAHLTKLIATQRLTYDTEERSAEYKQARAATTVGNSRAGKNYIAVMAIPTGLCVMRKSLIEGFDLDLIRWEIKGYTVSLDDEYWRSVLAPAWARITFPKTNPKEVKIKCIKNIVDNTNSMLNNFASLFQQQVEPNATTAIQWKNKSVNFSIVNEYLRTLPMRYQPKKSIHDKSTRLGFIALLDPLDVSFSMSVEQFRQKNDILTHYIVLGKRSPTKSVWDAKSIIVPLYDIVYLPLCICIDTEKLHFSQITYIGTDNVFDKNYEARVWRFIMYLSEGSKNIKAQQIYIYAKSVVKYVNEKKETPVLVVPSKFTPDEYRRKHVTALDSEMREHVKKITISPDAYLEHMKDVTADDFVLGVN
jgi:hypothetical protein